jgi:type II secretion system-associated lipoprotein
MIKLSNFSIFLIAIFVTFCQKSLVKKDEMPFINSYYSEKTYYLKKDITYNSNDIIKQGTIVKIWIEATPSLLKVKCYPVGQSRENSLGKMIAYQENTAFTGSRYTFSDLDTLVLTNLDVYNESEIKPITTNKHGGRPKKR